MPNDGEVLTNAEIADRLSTLAQLLSMEKANPYKIKDTVVRQIPSKVDSQCQGTILPLRLTPK